MLTPNRLALPLSLCLLACAGSDPTTPGNGGGDDSRPDPDQPMDVAGDYHVSSHFDISVRDLGEDIALFGLLSDIANNPWGAVSQRIADAAGVGLLAPLAESILDDNLSPALEQKIKDFATSFLDFSGDFDVVSQLEISGSDSNMAGTHRTIGMNVNISGKHYEWTFDPTQQEVATVSAQRSGQNVTFSEHDLVVPYSKMLLAAVDVAVVPALDPFANDLGEALATLVDCNAIGWELDGTLGMSASTLEALCQVGMNEVADEIYDYVEQIADLNVSVKLSGTAAAADANNDGKAEAISGSWAGEFAIGSYGTYNGNANFTGERVTHRN